jgi:hypothetical protein
MGAAVLVGEGDGCLAWDAGVIVVAARAKTSGSNCVFHLGLSLVDAA